MSNDPKKTINHNRTVKPEDLQRYANAEFLVDIETNNRLKISDIFVAPGLGDSQRREQQLTVAIHQALHSKSQKSALQDAEGRVLTPVKLDAESVEKVFAAKKQEFLSKEQELAEREARLAAREKELGLTDAEGDSDGIAGAADISQLTEGPQKPAAKATKAKK